MSKDFCLLDEPWLPVRLADGRVMELGLLETFARSGEIVGLAETAPPSLVAEYRLLLAITHRALAAAFGDWRDKDRARWYREGLPLAEIRTYLEHWRERFWLFHPEHPFMQVAALATCEETRALYPVNTVALEQFYGPEMFNQEIYAQGPWNPASVLRSLLGYLQFVPGGFFPGKKLKSSEKAGPLTNTAAVLPTGHSLARTLLLALHSAPREGHQPDLPNWERDSLSIAALRGEPTLASGPNDRYTRLSRAVLLCREEDGGVRCLHFAAGMALGEDAQAPDPMASFRAGSNGLVRLTFGDGRVLWRDLPALVPSTGEGVQAAAVVQFALGLHQALNAFEQIYQPLLVAGLASNKGKLLRWRSERLVLPTALLLEAEKGLFLRERVADAESLFAELKRLATGLLADTLPDPSSKDTRARARSLVEAGPLNTTYFASAERSLPAVLQQIGEGEFESASRQWRGVLRSAAMDAWQQVLAGLGNSPRAARADARYWPRFQSLVKKHATLSESLSPHKEAAS
ncbi:type I-E CRISPR-associated protein Cse1/CasA [Pseudomarimonas arenosa]|uniref:Type I-E CRISPR-associated protein Cse1/CasA n=1 Tax=Pseudomarimonas arenosa TaxID=2774145 RepID=A0AAW3ZKK7_9GAMM|nr:type I-E CRISPR-associated protein Cse1/CasA [Pseudomarimonas arenosa]MBD8525980.1 type I-E CRISPR-associated protein Cse1/CasA [Pseudomarimonas arenosa]